MAEAIEAMTAVTIAQIHGHCVGGAVVLAAACDLRIAAEDTRFAIPEVDLGIPLTWGGIPRLVREIGPARTKELVMTCRPFGAAEALAAGFLNRVVPAAGLDAEIDELVGLLVDKSAFTLTATKRHTNAVTDVMVGAARAWNDADSLVTALHDPESRAAGVAYVQGLAADRQTAVASVPRCSACIATSDVEVLGFGVVQDERVGRLLRMQLHFLRQRDPDALGLQQRHGLDPVLQIRARAVAERVPGTAVSRV